MEYFFFQQFLHHGDHKTVLKTLHRLVKKGKLERLSRSI